MSDAHKPLTALDLADALSCFWNAAIGAAHERQEGFDTANIMVSGFSAVEQRLREIDSATPDTRDALIKELVAAAKFLWDRLDDIDTLDDACRENDKAFRENVRQVQRRRFEVGTTDGFSVTLNAETQMGSK